MKDFIKTFLMNLTKIDFLVNIRYYKSTLRGDNDV